MTKTVIILFIFFSFLLPDNTFAHSQIQIIEITPDGFIPQSVTIDQNSTIIFVNKDETDHWPASNTHPHHDLYPEFDPKKPIKPGESWTLKQDGGLKIGEWRFHDHLHPHQRGILTVTEEEASEKKESNFINEFGKFLEDIWTQIKKLFTFESISIGQKSLPDKNIFFAQTSSEKENTIKVIAESHGADMAWQYLKNAFKGEAGADGDIHDLSHLAGGLIYEKNGFNGLGNCTSEYAFGCYHGFLDVAFAKNLDLLRDAEKSCLKMNSRNTGYVSGPAASCIHGIGHGVASFYSTANLNESLTSCAKLSIGKEYCYDGVFMEFVRNAKDSFFNKNDSFYPCSQLEIEFGDEYSFACGRNQPSLLMGRFDMEFNQVISVCHSSNSKPFKEGCFDSLGFTLAALEDPKQVIDGCQNIGENEFASRCLVAAAGEMVFQEVPNWREKSREVCDAALEEKENCQPHVDRLILEYGR